MGRGLRWRRLRLDLMFRRIMSRLMDLLHPPVRAPVAVRVQVAVWRVPAGVDLRLLCRALVQQPRVELGEFKLEVRLSLQLDVLHSRCAYRSVRETIE